jgi:thioesterase domain-containing protein
MVGVLPPQTDIELVRGLLQVFRTQSQIDYLPHNTSPTPICLFRSQDGIPEQEDYPHIFQKPAWGWNQFSDGEVKSYTVPGGHISMMSEPHVKVLAQQLQKSLYQAQSSC